MPVYGPHRPSELPQRQVSFADPLEQVQPDRTSDLLNANLPSFNYKAALGNVAYLELFRRGVGAITNPIMRSVLEKTGIRSPFLVVPLAIGVSIVPSMGVKWALDKVVSFGRQALGI